MGLDIGLPDLDGYEVAQLIRGAEWGKSTVLVAAIRWGREDDKQRAVAAGFNQHLTKPIAGEELLALLRSLERIGSGLGRHREPSEAGFAVPVEVTTPFSPSMTRSGTSLPSGLERSLRA